MKELGNRNLFISEFIVGCELNDPNQFECIIGCNLPKRKQSKCIETVSRWIYIKENDYGMKNYSLERTQLIAFLHIIDIELFKEKLIKLVSNYKKSYPFGEKIDFIEYTFRYSLYALEKFNNIHDWNIIYYGQTSNIKNDVYFYDDDRSKNPITDYILEPSKDIKWYKQLYKKIINLIKEVDFDSKNTISDLIPLKQTKNEKADESLKLETAKNFVEDQDSKINANSFFNATPQSKKLIEIETPKTFEELFHNPEDAELCLKILNELKPPVIDTLYNYIGKAKGVFPLWISILKTHKPKPLIKPFKDSVYKDLLNQKIKGLNLTKDASEFRKTYARLEKNNIKLDIKTLLSQYSQEGKLGK